MTTKTLDFLETAPKVGNIRAMTNKVSDGVLDKISTNRIIWHLVKRHKFGLVSVWAVLITVLWVFPPAADMLLSLIR